MKILELRIEKLEIELGKLKQLQKLKLNYSNHVKEFVTEKCEIVEYGEIIIPDLYCAYIDWCKNKNTEAMSIIQFGKNMKSMGIFQSRSLCKRFWRNISLKV